MAWVDRNAYAERLWAIEGTRDIKAITGMRRSGKSELMKVFSTSIAWKDPSSNNVYIDLLDLDNEPLLEHHALHLLTPRCLRLLWGEALRHQGEEVPEHAGEALRLRLGNALCGPGDARHGLGAACTRTRSSWS